VHLLQEAIVEVKRFTDVSICDGDANLMENEGITPVSSVTKVLDSTGSLRNFNYSER